MLLTGRQLGFSKVDSNNSMLEVASSSHFSRNNSGRLLDLDNDSSRRSMQSNFESRLTEDDVNEEEEEERPG